MDGGTMVTVSVAALLVTVPPELETIHRNCEPLFDKAAATIEWVEKVEPKILPHEALPLVLPCH